MFIIATVVEKKGPLATVCVIAVLCEINAASYVNASDRPKAAVFCSAPLTRLQWLD